MPLPLDRQGQPRERVVRQLAEAMLYERLVDASETHEGNRTFFDWTGAGRAFRALGFRGAFDRVRLLTDSIEVQDRTWRAAGIADLVACLPGRNLDRLKAELERTAELCARNDGQVRHLSRRGLAYAALEGALDEGHAYHPCFKARTGFSDVDHDSFGPESGSRFQLAWLAVARGEVRQNLPCGDREFWQQELDAETWALIDGWRAGRGIAWDSHALLPMHPWQWRKIGPTALAPWLADGTAVFLGFAGPDYVASQSIRTLINADRPHAANIKLPLSMVNSSSLRTLEPHSVCTAPVVSQWLREIVGNDPLFADTYPLTILDEYAGIIAGRDGPLAGQVAAIWRRSTLADLVPGEAAVPFNALMVTERDGRPFIDDWIARHGLDAWLDQLLRVAVLPVWHLLVGHGIATESHGQNMVLVHRDGWPVRLVLRDFHDSVEYVPSFLRDPARVPDFLSLDPAYAKGDADEFYWMERVESLGELVADALFVFNLAEVAHLLATRYGLPEVRFWQTVRAIVATYAQDTGLSARQARLGLDRTVITTDALLARKLGIARTSHDVANALFSPDV